MLSILMFCGMVLLGFYAYGQTFNSTNRFAYGFNSPGRPRPFPKPKKKTKDSKPSTKHEMALVKYSGVGAVAISGKIGGTVFTNSGVMGPFIRNWAKPRRVLNAATMYVKGLFAGLSSAYKGLTPTQLASWSSAARTYFRLNVFGDLKKLTPNTLFMQVNNILTILGLTTTDTAPSVPAVAVDSITVLTPDFNTTGSAMTFDATLFSAGAALPANTHMIVYATRGFGPSQQSLPASAYKLIGTFPPTTNVTGIDIETDYVAQFGALPGVGTRVGLKTELIYRDGTGNTFSKTGKVTTTAIVI